jgi:hypothetical protein
MGVLVYGVYFYSIYVRAAEGVIPLITPKQTFADELETVLFLASVDAAIASGVTCPCVVAVPFPWSFPWA